MATVAEAVLNAFDLQSAGRVAEAEDLYQRVLAVDPVNADALHLSGILLVQTDRVDSGYRRISTAIVLRPDRADYALNLGALARAVGQADTATTLFRRAVTLGAQAAIGPLVELLRQRGSARLDAGNAAEAEADFRDALALSPKDEGLTSGLVDARYDRGDWRAAVAACRALLILSPSSHRAHYNRGAACFEAGWMGQAATAFARAAVLEPERIETLDYLAVALFHDGRLAETTEIACTILQRKDRMARATYRGPALPDVDRSDDSRPEGRRRRIIAFSLWGQSAVYTQGAIENLRLAPRIYPGWTCRFYHDDSVPRSVLAALAELGGELVAMEPGSGPVLGLYWRFLASDDPQVDLFLCRDADSRLNSREKAAVDLWLASGEPFHVMRDHALHTELMLAGMWGGRAGLLPPLEPLVRAHARPDGGRLKDQRFLGSAIWPMIAGHCVVHDSAHPGYGAPFPDVGIDPQFGFEHVGACVRDL